MFSLYSKRNSPDLVDYYKKVRVWIAGLERDGVIINGATHKVSFDFHRSLAHQKRNMGESE